MPPPGFINQTMTRMQQAAANAQARSTAQQIQQTERLRRATELLNRERDRGNDLAREAAQLQRAGDHAGAAQAAAAHTRQMERANEALEARNRILAEQGAIASRVQQSMQAASQRLSSGISNIAADTITKMRAQIERAHHALLQNARNFSDVNSTGLTNAVAGYQGALTQAIKIGIKYGQSVDDITQIQHNLVEVLRTDVTQGGWVEGISAISENFANMASRTGRSVAEVAQAQMELSRAFGRGSQAEVLAFTNQMNRASMIPEVMRQHMEALGEQTGQVFDNRTMMIMLEHWADQFMDQADSIADMTANMTLFRAAAIKAGYSMRTIDVMSNALAQGTIGRRGHSANTVMAGRELQRRYANASEEERNAMLGNLEGRERERAENRLRSGNGLAASSAFHLLRGTTAGIDAMLQTLKGVYGQDVSIAGEMLEAQGFGTGDTRTNEALADLLQQRAEGADNTAEIQQLLTAAQQREQEQQQARDSQYTNVAMTALAMERVAGYAEELVRNTGPGGAIVAGVAGVAAIVARAASAMGHPEIANEWQDLFMGRVAANAGGTTTSQASAETSARQAAALHMARQGLQGLSNNEDFDINSTEGHRQIVGVLSRARRDLTNEQLQSVNQKLADIGIPQSIASRLMREAQEMATSGRAGEGLTDSAQYQQALRDAAARARAQQTPQTQSTSATPTLNQINAQDQQRAAARAAAERRGNAENLIQQSTTPATTPASAPAPAPAAPSTPAAPNAGQSASMAQVGAANGRLAANGDLEIPTVLRISNFVPLVGNASAQLAAPRPFGT